MINPKNLEIITGFLKDCQMGTRKMKYFLNSDFAKNNGIKTKEDLNNVLRATEIYLIQIWAEQINLENK